MADSAPVAAVSAPPPDSSEAAREKKLRQIFLALAVMTLIINLDGGGVPAALVNIQRTFQLTPIELGILGALVYVGQASGSVLCGPLLKKYSPTRVCQVALVANTFATFMFAMAQSNVWLLSARFLIGVLQAAPAVYFPVWVDEFGPESSRTVWMAAIQAGAPLGIMMGYVFAGIMTNDPNDTFGWRVPFLVQSAVLSVFSLLSPGLPKSLFDIGMAPKPPGALPASYDAGGAAELTHNGKKADAAEAPTSGLLPGKSPSNGSSQDRRSLATPLPALAEGRDSATSMPSTRQSFVSGPFSQIAASAKGSLGSPSVATSRESHASRETRPSVSSSTLEGLITRASFVAAHMPFGNQAMAGAVTGRERLDSTAALSEMFVANHEQVGSSLKRMSCAVGGASSRMSRRLSDAPTSGRESPGESQGSMPSVRELAPSIVGDEGAAVADDDNAPAGGAPAAGGAGGAAELPPTPLSTRDAVKQLLGTSTYMYTVGAMSALFFVVTGIQFWVTMYLVKVLGGAMETVVGVFAASSITMPILGVAVGATIVDRLGGYAGPKGVARTLKICATFCTLAAAAAFMTCFVPPMDGDGDMVLVVGLICVTLFFGGCVIPSATGVLMEVAAPEARPVASAGSMFAFQTFGYALAPLVSAIVMQAAGCGSLCDEDAGVPPASPTNATGNLSYAPPMPPTAPPALPPDEMGTVISPKQLTWGFRTVMAWGLIGATFMTLAWRAAERDCRLKLGAELMAVGAEGNSEAKPAHRPSVRENNLPSVRNSHI